MGWAASHWRRGRATGSSPSSMESRLVPVRGSPTMTHGPVDPLLAHLGVGRRPACSAMRLASAPASILETRMRPKVVRSASASHGAEEHLERLAEAVAPESSEPAVLRRRRRSTIGFQRGEVRPNRANRAPTPFSARSGRLRSSESRHV